MGLLKAQLLAFSFQAFSENLHLIKCFLQATSRIRGVLYDRVLLGFGFQLSRPEKVCFPAAPCRVTPVTWMIAERGEVGGRRGPLVLESRCEPGHLVP